MRIFNQDKTKEITQFDVDYTRYKLVDDKLFIAHHEAVEYKPEKSRLVVVAEYPNGGKTVEKVVDEEEVQGHEAYDEYEDILRLEPLNEQELAQQKLSELTKWFDDYFDKQFNQSLWQDDFEVSHDDYFDRDYAGIDELKAQATIVRNEIRELRKKLEVQNG